MCLNSAGSGPSLTSLWVPGWGQSHAESCPRWLVPPSVLAVLWVHALCVPPGLAVTSHSGREEIGGVLLRCLFAPEGFGYLEGIGMPQYLEMKREGLGLPSPWKGPTIRLNHWRRARELLYLARLCHKNMRTISDQRPISPEPPKTTQAPRHPTKWEP